MRVRDLNKLAVSIRYLLYGAEYHEAIRAMEYASLYHTGKRSNGEPEFIHQVEIALYGRTLSLPEKYREPYFCVAFLHDTVEDKPVSPKMLREHGFTEEVVEAVEILSKVMYEKGVKKDMEFYFAQIIKNPVAALVKGADRIHNFQSMVGSFSIEKQKIYLAEAGEHIIPAMKAARRLYPDLEPAFENIKLILTSQMQLIAHGHDLLEGRKTK